MKFDLIVFTHHLSSYAPHRFKKEAEKLGLSCALLDYENVDYHNLPLSSFVILREPDYKKNIYPLRDSILNFYIAKKTKILNRDSYIQWSVLDKITQHLEFEKAHIPHIPILKLAKTNYPFIAKNKLGSHGDSVYKITSKDDLCNVLSKHDKKDLLFQEFQNSGFDLRAIVLGGRVLGIMKRSPKIGEFLSNYSQGGSVSLFESPEKSEVSILAVNTAKHFKLDYVGVDLMMGNDGSWKVLEVNRACQFKGFEQATDINVALEVLKFGLNLE